jgi:ABC-type lipoprotein export system ATPase subunit
MYVVIDGNIGCGKSSVLETLSKGNKYTKTRIWIHNRTTESQGLDVVNSILQGT